MQYHKASCSSIENLKAQLRRHNGNGQMQDHNCRSSSIENPSNGTKKLGRLRKEERSWRDQSIKMQMEIQSVIYLQRNILNRYYRLYPSVDQYLINGQKNYWWAWLGGAKHATSEFKQKKKKLSTVDPLLSMVCRILPDAVIVFVFLKLGAWSHW